MAKAKVNPIKNRFRSVPRAATIVTAPRAKYKQVFAKVCRFSGRIHKSFSSENIGTATRSAADAIALRIAMIPNAQSPSDKQKRRSDRGVLPSSPSGRIAGVSFGVASVVIMGKLEYRILEQRCGCGQTYSSRLTKCGWGLPSYNTIIVKFQCVTKSYWECAYGN